MHKKVLVDHFRELRESFQDQLTKARADKTDGARARLQATREAWLRALERDSRRGP